MEPKRINISSITHAVIIAATILLMGYMVMERVDKYLLYIGVHQCSEISRVTFTNSEGAEISFPYKETYEQCLDAKGIVR